MNRLVAMNIDEWTEDNVHSSSLGGIRGAARSAERSAKVNVATAAQRIFNTGSRPLNSDA